MAARHNGNSQSVNFQFYFLRHFYRRWLGLDVSIVFSRFNIIIWQYIIINFLIADGYFTRYEWTCQLSSRASGGGNTGKTALLNGKFVPQLA